VGAATNQPGNDPVRPEEPPSKVPVTSERVPVAESPPPRPRQIPTLAESAIPTRN